MGRTNCPSPQVLLQANDGAGEFSTWVTYPKLCDGQWHRVAGEGTLSYREGWLWKGHCSSGWLGDTICSTVTMGRNTLQLEVDTQSNHTSGPLPETLADSPALLHLGNLPSKYGLPCATSKRVAKDQAD